MLRFNKITIQNFGPYYGSQEIRLSPKNGVSFIWGLNGFGKTSFLNAVRYALWGSLANSKHAKRPIVKFINRKAIANGENMMVRLDCDYHGKRCVIIRLLKRNLLTDGNKSEDYEYSLSVSLDAQTLSQDDAEKFLSTTFPLNISRFYLFDAELLDQYEKLIEENNDNADLKLEIENILGLPILDGARHSLSGASGISGLLEKEYDRVSKEDKQNEKKIKSYEANKQKREQLENEIQGLKETLEKLLNSKQDLEDTLQDNDQFRKLVEEEKGLVKMIDSLSETLKDERQKVSEVMDNLWTIFFDFNVQDIIETKDEKRISMRDKIKGNEEETLLIDLVNIIEKNKTSHCPICSGDITPATLSNLKERLKSSSSNHNLRLEISKLQNDMLDLSNMKGNHSLKEVITALESYANIFDIINGYELELENVKTKKRSYHSTVTESEIIAIAQKYSQISVEIAEGKKGLAEAEQELVKTKNNIENLRNEISKNGGDAVKKVETQRHFVETLENIFNDGVSWFRDDLKTRVEKTASDIFRNIAHNKDYVGLRINDNYGLEILMAEGMEVPNRSEGYEQVVAISLIAALHKNAPIAGPIIMDSTFQRIDVLHKEATLKELPNMGSQIIVLAYPHEVSKTEATNLLGSNYLQDFELEQIDSLETKIHKI